MATLFPILQFFDNTTPKPLPLAAGLVYTYVENTTTPKTAYKQEAESSNHTNPIVLDANGRPPANGIWLNGAYKLVIKSADGLTTYHTLDSVKAYEPVDWSALTDSLTGIADLTDSLGTPGTVEASKGVVVDSNKDISSFGTLTAETLTASTKVVTPIIADSNGLTAVQIATVANAVNYIQVSPAATGVSPSIAAAGTDTDINLNLTSQGSGKVGFNGVYFPSSDGSSGQTIVTDGSGTLSFSTLTGIKNFQFTNFTTLVDCSTVMPIDNTRPQNTEGTQVTTLAITPTSATSKLLITCCVNATSDSTSRTVGIALFQDSTTDALAAINVENGGVLQYTMTSGTTSATTFKLRVGPSASGHVYVNGNSAGTAMFNGRSGTSITIMEI